MEYSIKTQSQSITVTDQGALVLGWQVFDAAVNRFEPVLYESTNPKRLGIPLLFPFANPLENNLFEYSGLTMPQHGFARNSNWKLVDITADQIELSLNHDQISTEMRLAYPFEFELGLTLHLRDDDQMSYSLTTQNLSEQPLPIAPGIHPYFPIIHTQKQLVKIPQIPEFQAQSFDWESELDGSFFDFQGKAEIQFPGRSIIIDTSESPLEFQHLVVWSQNQQQADHNFICFEPFSRTTNAINTDPILIPPGKSLQSKITFEVNFG
jgi:galactose mutarotase-like enzyme